jgi:hypothetical protein
MDASSSAATAAAGRKVSAEQQQRNAKSLLKGQGKRGQSSNLNAAESANIGEAATRSA